jgi:hypothetical protein
LEQSNLLNAAEKVVLLYHAMVDQVNKDPMQAANALIQLTVGINELAEEVNKGKAMIEQFSQMKEQLMAATPTKEQSTVALNDILSSILTPKK